METKHTRGPWRQSATTKNAVICDSIKGHDCRTNLDYCGGHLIAESIFSEADRDLIAAAPDLFEVTSAADHVVGAAEMVPALAGGFAPCGRALGGCGKATQTCGRDGCGVEVVEMPPQHAPIAAVLEGLASGDPAEPVAPDAPADSELKRQAEQAAARRAMGGKPVAMYLDPATGQTWSGRGLKPKWMLAAIEAGKTQDEFLIKNQGAQA